MKECLKNYTNYLIEIYKNINTSFEDSGIYWELKQFYNSGTIKDILYKNNKISIKAEVLNDIRNDIIKFSKDINIEVEVLSFEDYLKII